MATIGLDKLFYSTITEVDGIETYDPPKVLAKAIKADLSVELIEAILYANDGAADVVKEFKSGKLSLGVDDIGTTIAEALTGAVADDNGVLISGSEDISAPVAIGLMFTLFYNSEIGIFNHILKTIGLGSLQKNWLSDANTLLYAVMAPQVWQYIGLYVTIFLGALQSIPEELIESAQIDGAGRINTFFHVILPQIKEFTFICILLSVTGSLKSFDHSWIMTGGGPGVRSAYLGVFMYKTAFVNSDFGMGSAITIGIIAVSLMITVIFNKLTKMRSDD